LGSIISASSINWGFSASDILSNSVTLFGTLAGFIILGLAFGFAPSLISLIRNAVLGEKTDRWGFNADEAIGSEWEYVAHTGWHNTNTDEWRLD